MVVKIGGKKFSIENCFKKLELGYEEYGLRKSEKERPCSGCGRTIAPNQYYVYHKRYDKYEAYHPTCFEVLFPGADVVDTSYGLIICVNERWKNKYIFKKTRGKKG